MADILNRDRDSVKLVRVGDHLVLMVEVYPCAYMLALDDEQAADLAEGLLKGILAGKGAAKDDSLGDVFGRLKKKTEEPS